MIWQKTVNIKEYTAYEGYYYVLISSHSRLAALKAIPVSSCEIKIHYINSSEEILDIQLDENIH